ncbi:TRAM, LAG1 and CLN8 (TLC) lipid-sensing domain containing protein isoform X2 [Tasmannia lanceolata]
MCKFVYEVTGLISSSYFKCYSKLTKAQKVEWNNRGFSTFHALLVVSVAFYLVLLSDLFQNGSRDELIINRKSAVSDTILAVSIGYFLSDLAMILWQFPALGGKEYLLHHALSMYSIILSLLSGQGQIYILMVLFSECTTPFVNLRWYLDVAGQKSSKLYVYNGIGLFLGWLVARILLFIFFFVHMYNHFDQVKEIFPLGFYSLLTVPAMLALMNLFWFWKILKGLKKTLSKARHGH